jgi:uncharacterized CHY-type Zn-finger protein
MYVHGYVPQSLPTYALFATHQEEKVRIAAEMTQSTTQEKMIIGNCVSEMTQNIFRKKVIIGFCALDALFETLLVFETL